MAACEDFIGHENPEAKEQARNECLAGGYHRRTYTNPQLPPTHMPIFGPANDPYTDIVEIDGMVHPPLLIENYEAAGTGRFVGNEHPDAAPLIRGPSHFVPFPTDVVVSSCLHETCRNRAPCFRLPFPLPPGIGCACDMLVVRHVNRREIARGWHYVLFPLEIQPRAQFEANLAAGYVLCDWDAACDAKTEWSDDENDDDNATVPSYQGDWWVVQARALFVEMSKNRELDWNRRLRFRGMEIRLRSPQARHTWLFRGDAVTAYLAIALARCVDASFHVEEVRDNMRIRLRSLFGYSVELRVLVDLVDDEESGAEGVAQPASLLAYGVVMDPETAVSESTVDGGDEVAASQSCDPGWREY
jgi:hypothetical protein